MRLLKCFLTENDCYRAGKFITPKGIMVHSTGANNPMLRRYVQPGAKDADREQLLSLLGVNPNRNAWNRSGTNACVHAFIGKLDDGSVATVQTLPWNRRGWHAGSGTTRPSANDTHISFEICEDDLKNESYFRTVYREAVELTAKLCVEYDLDPLKPETVICHSEGHQLGMASGHGDVMHWFPRHGRSMDTFRADVAAIMEEEKRMSDEEFSDLMARWLSRRSKMPPSEWSKEEREWMETMKLLRGDSEGMHYKSYCTREEVAAILYRLEHP